MGFRIEDVAQYNPHRISHMVGSRVKGYRFKAEGLRSRLGFRLRIQDFRVWEVSASGSKEGQVALSRMSHPGAKEL